jgi:hypothetical protein
VLNSFSDRSASAATDNNTRSHSCGGSDGTSDNRASAATGSSANSRTHSHARHVITQIARATRVIPRPQNFAGLSKSF